MLENHTDTAAVAALKVRVDVLQRHIRMIETRLAETGLILKGLPPDQERPSEEHVEQLRMRLFGDLAA